ncbi:MAG: flavodoxin family protein, partial [Candidatus Omnitrophica bacterium]|nr:flavodoxin family protein [Candidatus Omnitrophota bacterium]
PTYYGSMAYQIKQLLDESVEFHGELAGKVGAAFSSSANVGGGNETTILDIICAMLIHGMIVQGDSSGDHYGPVAIGAPDARASKQCKRLGQRVAELVKKL